MPSKHECPACLKREVISYDKPYRDYALQAENPELHDLELPAKRFYTCKECGQCYMLITPQSRLIKINKEQPKRFNKNT